MAARSRLTSPTTARPSPTSAFDGEILLQQIVADAVAQITLKLDRVLGYGAAGAARALQALTEFAEKRGIARQVEHDGHDFPAAALFLDPQLRDNLARL